MPNLPTETETSRSDWAEFVLALLAVEAGENPDAPDKRQLARGIVDRAAQLEKTTWAE